MLLATSALLLDALCNNAALEVTKQLLTVTKQYDFLELLQNYFVKRTTITVRNTKTNFKKLGVSGQSFVKADVHSLFCMRYS